MDFFRKILNNRYIYAQYIAIVATVLSCVGLYKMMHTTASGWTLMFALGLLLTACAYCLGGLLTAVKSALSIAKWGWVVVPFPYDLVTLVVSFVFALIAFFLVPIIPIRKAYKEHMQQ